MCLSDTFERAFADLGVRLFSYELVWASKHPIANVPGYNTTTDNIDALCRYFECTPCELLGYVAEPPQQKG